VTAQADVRVMVAGIGNIFLGDDGFGVEVARRLGAQPMPVGVVVADVGVRALHLAFALLDRPDLLLAIDATSRGQPPGTLYLIEPSSDQDGTASFAEGTVAAAHGMSLRGMLAAVRDLGGQVPPTLLVGCEPAFVGEQPGLSPAVAAAVPRAVEMARQVIDRQLQKAASHAAREVA
jgi:hydrogenase maturation protease